MAQVKMEKTNNYFVVTDVDSGALVFEPRPSKDIRFELRNESVFLYDINNGLEYKHRDGYMAGLTGTVNLMCYCFFSFSVFEKPSILTFTSLMRRLSTDVILNTKSRYLIT